MLTGLLQPSSGSCSVMGHDVHRAAAHARQHIGYCPQANVLFGSLTVLEHLQLFCAIKGLSSGAFGSAAATASRDIMQVGWPSCQHLSMKRSFVASLRVQTDQKVVHQLHCRSGPQPEARPSGQCLSRSAGSGAAGAAACEGGCAVWRDEAAAAGCSCPAWQLPSHSSR